MATQLRVLILGDNPAQAEGLVRQLEGAGYAPTWRCVHTQADFAAHLDPAPDIILIDAALPELPGWHPLQLLEAQRIDIPVLTVAGTAGEVTAQECQRSPTVGSRGHEPRIALGQAVRRALEPRARAARVKRLRAIRTIGPELTCELELPVLLQLVCRRVAQAVCPGTVTVFLWNDATHTLIPRAVSDAGVLPAAAQRPVSLGEGLAGQVAQRRVGMRIPTHPPRPATLPSGSNASPPTIISGLGEPLLYRDRLIGVLQVERRTSDPVFTHLDATALRLFAPAAAVAIANAQLLETEQRRRQQLEAIRVIAAEMTQELDLPTLLTLIHRHATELLGTGTGTVFLWDEADQVLVPHLWHGLGEQTRELRLKPGEGAAGTVVQRGKGMVINDFRTSPYITPLLLERTRHVGVVAEPLIYRGQLLGVISVDSLDSRRRFTEQDRELLHLLAGHAAIAIANARLFQAQQRAFAELQRAQQEWVRTEKLRALGQLAAGVAHDLNNRLAVILSQAELLEMQTGDVPTQEGLGVLMHAASDAAALVRRLQDFARRRTASPRAPCDLCTAVREALEITRARWKDEMERRGRRVDIRLALDELPPILGDLSEVREAITNLIFNALDAMQDGGALTLAASVTPEGIRLCVTDTGVGMPEAIRQKLGEPFFTTKGTRGAGLGLAVVYGIMERHGGRIAVASTPGQGTSVTLTFPTAAGAEIAAPPMPSLPPAPRCLLLIDDDHMVRSALANLLRAAGHTVVEAEGGAAGLAALAQQSVDLVVTDLGMPEMNGWDVAQAIKQRFPKLPVVLLTGWGEQAAAEAQERRGAVDRVLGKPARLQILLPLIGELTRRPEA